MQHRLFDFYTRDGAGLLRGRDKTLKYSNLGLQYQSDKQAKPKNLEFKN